MLYHHYKEERMMRDNAENLKLNAILQKNFPDNTKWGACANFDVHGNVDFIEINKLSDVSQKGATWTHYATIGVYKSTDENNGQYWEVYSQFNGKNKDELWIFAYYKNFGDAVRRVKLGIENLKPIKVYY